MAHQIIWAPRAVADLREIVRYISRDNPDAARHFGGRLVAKAESLATFPERGRVIHKFADPNIREIFLRSYRIAYRIRSQPTPTVEIARIWHGAQSEEGFELE
jgi:addiction module RelE/StbE family toxin